MILEGKNKARQWGIDEGKLRNLPKQLL